MKILNNDINIAYSCGFVNKKGRGCAVRCKIKIPEAPRCFGDWFIWHKIKRIASAILFFAKMSNEKLKNGYIVTHYSL